MDHEVSNNTNRRDSSYRVRLFTIIIAVELCFILLFKLWPVQVHPDQASNYNNDEESIQVSDVQITYQSSEPPAPPKPVVPAIAPEYEIVDEEIDVTDQFEPVTTLEESEFSGAGNSDSREQGPVKKPGQPPRLIKIVEPAMPEEARKAGIKTEIWVKFLINAEGKVEEATIARIKIYKEDGAETVKHINYRLPEVTLKAALQWKFRPARQNGEKVKAYSTHVFSYGF